MPARWRPRRRGAAAPGATSAPAARRPSPSASARWSCGSRRGRAAPRARGAHRRCTGPTRAAGGPPRPSRRPPRRRRRARPDRAVCPRSGRACPARMSSPGVRMCSPGPAAACVAIACRRRRASTSSCGITAVAPGRDGSAGRDPDRLAVAERVIGWRSRAGLADDGERAAGGPADHRVAVHGRAGERRDIAGGPTAAGQHPAECVVDRDRLRRERDHGLEHPLPGLGDGDQVRTWTRFAGLVSSIFRRQGLEPTGPRDTRRRMPPVPPRRRRARPVADAPIDSLLPRSEDLAKGWLLALLEQAPLDEAPGILAAELTRDGPRLCEAALRASPATPTCAGWSRRARSGRSPPGWANWRAPDPGRDLARRRRSGGGRLVVAARRAAQPRSGHGVRAVSERLALVGELLRAAALERSPRLPVSAPADRSARQRPAPAGSAAAAARRREPALPPEPPPPEPPPAAATSGAAGASPGRPRWRDHLLRPPGDRRAGPMMRSRPYRRRAAVGRRTGRRDPPVRGSAAVAAARRAGGRRPGRPPRNGGRPPATRSAGSPPRSAASSAARTSWSSSPRHGPGSSPVDTAHQAPTRSAQRIADAVRDAEPWRGAPWPQRRRRGARRGRADRAPS